VAVRSSIRYEIVQYFASCGGYAKAGGKRSSNEGIVERSIILNTILVMSPGSNSFPKR
jgi:hypothetical protein